MTTDSARALLAEAEATGRPVVGCFPLYPPVELLHSLGLTPVVLWGLRAAVPSLGRADRHLQDYCCSVARHLAEFVLSDPGRGLAGLVTYNACDTLRNLPEILAEGLGEAGRELPNARFHLPAGLGKPGPAEAYLRREVTRLAAALEGTYGVSFSAERFRESVDLYRRARALSARIEEAVARGELPFGEAAALVLRGHLRPVEAHIAALESALRSARPGAGGEPRARVVVSGILPPPSAVCELLGSAGLRAVGNDIAALRRSYAYTPEGADSPEAYYADFYANHHPCPTLLHTADTRVDAVLGLVRELGARGFVFAAEKFCEYESFEFPHLARRLEAEGVRVLALEFTAADDRNVAAFRTRVEAFAEVLEQP